MGEPPVRLRIITAIVAGLVVWMVGFFVIGIAFGLLWPAYAEAARFMFRAEDFSYFTTPMLFVNWLVFLGTGLIAGWLAAWIGKNRIAPLVVAVLYLAYGMVNHYVLVWDKLPGWYNLIVPFVMAVPIVLGGRLVGARSGGGSG
jgi:hypothetical protein